VLHALGGHHKRLTHHIRHLRQVVACGAQQHTRSSRSSRDRPR
jgi:hypothetical protein